MRLISEAQRHLLDTRAVGACELTECRTRLNALCVEYGGRIYAVELRMVESVVHFPPELQGYLLFNADIP